MLDKNSTSSIAKAFKTFECMNDTFEMGSILMFISMLMDNIFLYTTFVILKFNNLLGVLKQMLNQKKSDVILMGIM